MSTYSAGVTFGAQTEQSSGTTSTRLFMFIPDAGTQSVARDAGNMADHQYLSEYVSPQLIYGEIGAIVESPATNPAFGPVSYRTEQGITLNPLSRQAAAQPREILVLTPGALYTYALNRPIDLVQSAMNQDRNAGYAMVKQIFGPTQVTAMGVALGSELNLKVADNANLVATIMINGGEPSVVSSIGGNQIAYSYKHEGLALVVARILRPVWNRNVTVKAANGLQMSAVSKDQLWTVQRNLENLRRFVEEE
jgi:nuclear pore complex protein Nup155